MMKAWWWFALGATALLAGSCSFDLSLPEQPQRGGVVGSLALAGHLPADGGYLITLVDEDGAQQSQVTDGSARFVFNDLRPATYHLEARVPGFERFVRPGIKVKPGQTVELGALDLLWLQGTAAEAILTGKVTVAGGSGSAAGGQVEFILEAANRRMALSAIGLDGTFVQRLPPGSYTLRAAHPAFVTGVATGVAVAEGEDRDISATPIVLDLNPATLTGKVMKEVDGKPAVAAANALVTISTGATTTADPQGNFQLTGLPGGAHSVRFALTGFHDPTVQHPVALSPGQSTALATAPLLLLDRGTITGRVETTDNSHVSEVLIALSGGAYTAIPAPDSADQSKGSFRLTGVPVDSYTVTASRARYASAAATGVTVSANATTDLSSAPLILAPLSGDFEVDDGDPASIPGYVNRTALTIKLNNVNNLAAYRVSLDPAFSDMLAFQNASGNTIAWTLPTSTEGLHTIYLQYRDTSGTQSASLSTNVVLDTLQPTAGLTLNNGAAYTNQPATQSLTVALSGDGTGSGLHRMILGEALGADGGVQGTPQSFAPFSPYPRAGADGVQTVRAQVMDEAGNLSAPVSASIIIDTVAPSGSIAIRRGAAAALPGYTNDDDVLIDQSWGPDSDVLIRLANSSGALQNAVLQPTQAVVGWRLDPSSEGLKTVHGQLYDRAGNTSSPLTASITYDVTPPAPVGLAVLSAAVTSDAGVSLRLEVPNEALAPDAGVTLSESVLFTGPSTTGPFAFPAGGLTQFTVSTGADGLKTVYGRFRDIAGNVAVAEAAITLDRLAPSGAISLTGTLADGTPSTERTSTASVSLALIQQGATGYLVGDETLTACPSTAQSYLPLAGQAALSVSLTGTASPRVVRLCLRDDAGNLAGPLEDTIALDAQPPAGCTLSLEAERAGGWVSNGNTAAELVRARFLGCSEVPAEAALVESASAINCSTAGLPWKPFGDPQLFELPAGEGVKTVRACVRDAARNPALLVERTITLDQTKPTLTLSLTTTSPTGASSATVSVTAADTGGSLLGADALTASEDPSFATAAAGPVANASSLTVPLSAGDGQKRLYVRVRDGAGNETVGSVVLERDTTPPTGGSVLIFGTLGDGTESTSWATTTAVTVALSAPDAVDYAVTSGSTCPASGYTSVPQARVSTALLGTAGTRSVSVCFRDAAGNVTAAPVTDTIGFDDAAPTACTLTLEASRAGAWVASGFSSSRTVRARLQNCVENPAQLAIVVDGTCGGALAWAPFAATTEATLPATQTGHTVTACVRDAQLNAGAIGPLTIALDTTPPSLSAASIAEGAATREPAVSVITTASDANGLAHADAFTISEDTYFQSAPIVGPRDWASLLSFPLSAGEGLKTIHLRVRDVAGNETLRTLSVTRDATPPSGSFELTGTLADGSPSAEYTTTGSAVAALRVSPDTTGYLRGDASLTSCPSTLTSYTALSGDLLTLSFTGAGPQIVRLCFRDAAGNVSSTWAEDVITHDDGTPTGCALALTGKRATGESSTTHTVDRVVPVGLTNCSEEPAEIALSLSAIASCSTASGLSWQPLSQSSSFSLPDADQVHTLRACVRDAARHLQSATPAAITLDRTPPSFSAASVTTPMPTNQGSVAISITATDAFAFTNADALTHSSDEAFSGATPSAFSASLTHDVSGLVGAGTVYLRVRDAAGNEARRTVAVERDVTPPSGTVTIVGLRADGTQSPSVTSSDGNASISVDVPGAVQYAIANGATLDCASASYSGLPSGTISGWTLAGSGASRSVALCFKDAAGNATAAPIVDSIDFDAAAPEGCALTLVGRRVEGTDAGTTKTALGSVLAVLSGCPASTEFFLTNAAACSSAVSTSWAPFGGAPVTVEHLLTGTPGTNTVTACVRDAARNVGTFTDTIQLDQSPPGAYALSIDGDDPYLNADEVELRGGFKVTVTASATDAVEWSIVESDGTSSPPPFTSWQAYSGAPLPYTFDGAGSRPELLYAQFRDEVGNLSAVVADDVQIDVDRPHWTGSPLSLVVPRNNNRTSSTSVTVRAEAADGGPFIALGEDTVAPAGCDPDDLANNAVQPVGDLLHAFLLSGSEGEKRLCARWSDEAGNTSTVAEQTVVLDQTAPPLPVLLTQGRTFNPDVPPNSQLQRVEVSTFSQSATDHEHWEVIGGAAYNQWTERAPDSISLDRLGFDFPLSVDGGETGFTNILSLRSVDTTGNASEASAVVMIADNVPPRPVVLSSLWVDTASGTANAYWTATDAGTSADTIGYNVYYNSAPGDPDAGLPSLYTGNYASQGASPVFVDRSFVTLTGLPNGAATHVTVRAVDHAGNVGRGPPVAPAEIIVQPNIVSPDVVNKLPVLADAGIVPEILLTNTKIDRVVLNEGIAYISAIDQSLGCGINKRVVLRAVSLRDFDAPVVGTSPNPQLRGLELHQPQWFALTGSVCNSDSSPRSQLHLDYPYLYLVASSTVFVLEVLTDPKRPQLVTQLDFRYTKTDAGVNWPALNSPIYGFDAKGNNAFVSYSGHNGVTSASVVQHLDLQALFDGNPSTKPRLADIRGTQMDPNTTPVSLALRWTRDRLIGNTGGGSALFFNVAAALDDAGTTFGSPTSRMLDGGTVSSGGLTPVTLSGNYSFAGTDTYVQVSTVEKLWTDQGPYCEGVVQVSVGSRGQMSMGGAQLFTNDPGIYGLRALDFSTVYDPELVASVRLSGTPQEATQWGQAVFGNYLIAGTGEAALRVFEIAKPRALRMAASAPPGAYDLTVGPGVIYGGHGLVYDLLAGKSPVLLGNGTADQLCTAGAAVVDDYTVSAVGLPFQQMALRVTKLDAQLDRQASTAFNMDAGSFIVDTGDDENPVAVEAYGNYIVVASRNESWSTKPGLWLEVFDARRLRAGSPSPALPKVGELRLSTYAVASYPSVEHFFYMRMAIVDGRAVVVVDDYNLAAPAVIFADLRTLMDDDALTNPGPDAVQGVVDWVNVNGTPDQLVRVHDVVVRDQRVFVIARGGLNGASLIAFDAPEAFDNDPLTTVGNGVLAWRAVVPIADSLAVYGRYAFITPYRVANERPNDPAAEGITVLDIGDLTNIRKVGFHPYKSEVPYTNQVGPQSPFSCGSGIKPRTHTRVYGSKLYVSSGPRLDIFDLE